MLPHKQLVATWLFLSLLSVSVFAEPSMQYKVTHVADDDSLNIRAGAGVGNAVVAAIPFNGSHVRATGEEHAVGKTIWVKIKWQGKEGWVSKHYLQTEQASNEQPIVTQTPVMPMPTKLDPEFTKKTPLKTPLKTPPKISTPSKEKRIEVVQAEPVDEVEVVEKKIVATIVTEPIEVEVGIEETIDSLRSEKNEKRTGRWILQCGDKKPYWKVELRPKSLAIYRDKYKESLPITLKKQHKNKWNTALKTVVKGKKGKDNLEMTIKYAYSKRCYDTLSSLVVPYKVTTIFNGETLTGCCHAVQLEEEIQDRQISKIP